MKTIVLGAGITGITTAWYLRQQGHDVTVIDRQSGPGLEASKANGCQISVSHAEPWANPSAPLKILKWLGQEDAPLLYRFKFDPNQWKWCYQFLKECSQKNTDKNIRDIVTMAQYSLHSLQQIRKDLNLKYDQLQKGILHFYTDQKEFDESKHAANLMRQLGCPRTSVTGKRVVEIEPALKHLEKKIVGGDFTPNDESGDPYKFINALERKAHEAGVKFYYNTTITKLMYNPHTDRVRSIQILDRFGYYDEMPADNFVVCMGSYSAELVKPLGVNLLIYPGKGYSATYRVIDDKKAPSVSLTDDEHKLVFSRIGNRLRVAGTCELNGYTRDLNMTRCRALTRRAKQLFPGACDYDNPEYWSGLRPLTPSNVPYVGKTKVRNLYLNTGHGTLGWTMGCGSGKAIADIIVKGKSEVENFRFTK